MGRVGKTPGRTAGLEQAFFRSMQYFCQSVFPEKLEREIQNSFTVDKPEWLLYEP